jgi:predicted RNA binding protein YcfA (HicA-like mRNA interferase family)/predicted RNase H-like HicB family nuclease
MKTYNFRVVIEPDEDFDGNPNGWRAYCPLLEQQGASTWGGTESEALTNINDVVRMVVESMLEHGERIPEEPSDQVEVTVEPRVAITVWFVEINYGLLRNLSARDIISALVRDGFAFDRGDGSHQIYFHADGRRVTVMFHGASSTFTRKTLKSMLKQAQWTQEDLQRLKFDPLNDQHNAREESTVLQHFLASAITLATAYPATSAVENTASRRTNGLRDSSWQGTLLRSRTFAAHGFVSAYRGTNALGRDERGIFVQSLARWMGGPLSPVAFKVRHWG